MPRTRMDELFALAEENDGLFTSRQAREMGIKDSVLVRLAQRGRLERTARGVYRVAHYPADRFAQYREAVLWAQASQGPERIALSHETALLLYEISDANPAGVHLTVPKAARLRRETPGWIVIHKDDLAPQELAEYEGMPITSVERTLLDILTTSHRIDFVRRAITEARREGFLNTEQVSRLRQAVNRHAHKLESSLTQGEAAHVYMSDNIDVYFTPEQVAEKLQLTVDTVYRWLRKGDKLHGSRLSQKAWRISERDLMSFVKRQNVSELLFEEYMVEYNLGPAEHHPQFPRSTNRVDYRLLHHGRALWFEVKEFDADVRRLGSSFDSGAIASYLEDPYGKIRNKIDKAKEKFRDYDGECCSLVLFNQRVNLVFMDSPRFVLSAMLGDVGWTVPIKTELAATGSPTNVFTRGGKLNQNKNTTISAVIALERLPVGQRRFQIEVAKIETSERRRLSLSDLFELRKRMPAGYDECVLRAVVYENPFTPQPLTRDVFTGPFDERWGPSGDWIAPVYTGAELQILREHEHAFQLDIGPLQRHLKRANEKAGALGK